MSKRISTSLRTEKYLSLRTLACQRYPFDRAFLGETIKEAVEHFIEHQTDKTFQEMLKIGAVLYPNLEPIEREKRIRKECVMEYVKWHKHLLPDDNSKN